LDPQFMDRGPHFDQVQQRSSYPGALVIIDDAAVLAIGSLAVTLINVALIDHLIEGLFEREFTTEKLEPNEGYTIVSVRVAQSLITVVSFVAAIPLLSLSIAQVYSHLPMFVRILVTIVYSAALAKFAL